MKSKYQYVHKVVSAVQQWDTNDGAYQHQGSLCMKIKKFHNTPYISAHNHRPGTQTISRKDALTRPHKYKMSNQC